MPFTVTRVSSSFGRIFFNSGTTLKKRLKWKECPQRFRCDNNVINENDYGFFYQVYEKGEFRVLLRGK